MPAEAHRIPPITDPMGKYWDQPERERIVVTESQAYMTLPTLRQLKEYSHTLPTGTYVGKMWRRRMQGAWWLCWYDELDGKDITIQFRRIVLTADEERDAQPARVGGAEES